MRLSVKIRLLQGLISAVSLLCLTAIAETTAKLERNTIYSDQTVRLIIETTEDTNASPDYSSLNSNFNLLGTSTRQSVSITNGQQVSIKQWITELEPKNEGTFTVGPIPVGNQSTQRLRLTVLPPDSSAQQTGQKEIFIELSLEPEKAYVQQQIILTLRLFVAVNLVEGSLSDPAPENALVERLGDDIQYNASRGNQNYRVIERKYAIFPQRSGKMIIPSIRFQGRAEDPAQNNQQLFSSFFNQGRRVQTRSQPLQLEVSPPNPTFSGQHWLPAKNLQLRNLSFSNDRFEVGKPVTIQLRMEAQGLTAAQLPSFDLPASNNYQSYPDKAAPETTFDGQDMMGSINKSIAIIPTQSGTIDIPEITINWWNTETDSMETATLPAKRMEVIPASLNSGSTSDLTPPPVPGQAIDSVATHPLAAQPDSGNLVPGYWKWISIALVLAWIMTIALFLQTRKRKTPAEKQQVQSDPTLSKITQNLKTACDGNNAEQARHYLLLWLQKQLPNRPTVTLKDISLISEDPRLSDSADDIDRYLYSPNQARWEGQSLWTAIKDFKPKNKLKKQTDQIAPLYPV